MRLQVATPCKADWSKMTGDARVRHCAQCQLNVYNLSELTEAQGQALIEKTEGRMCARYFARPDGTVLTKDCPVGVKRKRRTYGFSLAALAALAMFPFLSSPAACPVDDGGGPVSVRELIDAVKLKLGLRASPRVYPVMGSIAAPRSK